MAYLTPDAPAVQTYQRRVLVIPDGFVNQVMFALLPLLDENNWEQEGTMTVDEAVQLMRQMWLDLDEVCP